MGYSGSGKRWLVVYNLYIITQLAGKIPLLYQVYIYIAFVWVLYSPYHLLPEPE